MLSRTLSSTAATTTTTAAASDLQGGSLPLGEPIPTDEHACSVSLPTWSSVVGYEEGDRTITTALKTGYPRFVYHPYVVQLMDWVVQEYGQKTKLTPYPAEQQQQQQPLEDCLLLPTADAAARCQAFLQQALETTTTGAIVDNALINPATVATSSSALCSRIRHIPVRVEQKDDAEQEDGSISKDDSTGWVHAVLFPAETAAGSEAKAYWQHTGEIVSSRRAERALQALNVPLKGRVTCSIQPQVRHSSFPSTATTTSSNTSLGSDCHYNPIQQLRARIADWAGLPPRTLGTSAVDNVFVTPSGMASIYNALRSTRRYRMHTDAYSAAAASAGAAMGGTAIVYGFPYLDTLKVCSRSELCPGGVEFFGCGDTSDLAKLEQLLAKSRNDDNNNNNQRRYCGLFTEVPSNPLLQCPDLYRLRELADEYDFCIVVDDTIANFLNVDVLSTGLADAVCTSLTKIVSGRGDAIAGSIVTNPYTVRGRWMQKDLMAQQEHLQQNDKKDNNEDDENINNFGLYCQDAQAILCNSADFVERNAIINETAEALADWLAEHPDVQTVFYPKHTCPHTYRKLMRQPSVGSSPTPHRNAAGYGGLMSIILHPHMCQRLFFDSLNVAKGPSLGTNFTLVCPYTLLAHYHELDFALSYNVPPNLLRIAVGLEPLSELRDKFGAALAQSRLYPKPSLSLQRMDPTTSMAPMLTTRSYSTMKAAAGATTGLLGGKPTAAFAGRIGTSRYQAHRTLRRLTALIR